MILTFAVNPDGLLVISADSRKMVVGPKTALFRRSMGPDKAVLSVIDKKSSITIEGAQLDIESYNSVADKEYVQSMSLEDAMRQLLAKWTNSSTLAPGPSMPVTASAIPEQSTASPPAEPIQLQSAVQGPQPHNPPSSKRPRTDGTSVDSIGPRLLALADEILRDVDSSGGGLMDSAMLDLLDKMTPFRAADVVGVSRTEVAHALLRLLERGSVTLIIGQAVTFRG